MAAPAAVDPEFAGIVYDDWAGRGGKDGAGIDRTWLPYVTVRWNRERAAWMDGNHRWKANGKHHEAIPSVARSVMDLKTVRDVKAAQADDLRNRHSTTGPMGDVTWDKAEFREEHRKLVKEIKDINGRIAASA